MGALPKLILVFLLVEFAVGRTITHYKTVTDANGNTSTKTWTTTEDDDEPESPFLGIATPEELIKQAAAAKGMDPVAVNELLAHKQPVVQTRTDEEGNVHTTTYKLEPDGTISRKTVTAMKPRMIGYSVNEKIRPENNVKGSPDSDWEWNPQRNPFNAPSFPRTYSRPWHPEPPSFDYGDFFRPQHKPKEDDSDTDEEPERPHFNFNFGKVPTKPADGPPLWNPWNQGSGFPFNNWHPSGFDGVDTNTPGTVTKTTKDENGNTITTTYTVGPKKWTPRVFNFPSWPEQNAPPELVPPTTPTTTTTTTTTIKPATTTTIKNKNEPERPAPKTVTLPSLEDFLKSQYGPSTTSTTTTTKTTTQETPKTTTPVQSKKPLTPTPLPSLEDFLKSQYGPSTTTSTQRAPKDREPTTPKTQATPITKKKEREVPTTTPLPSLDDFLKSQSAPPKRPQIELTTTPTLSSATSTSTSTTSTVTPESETTVRTYTKTVHSPQLPTAADLDPNMQDVLKRAGITPDDIKSANGDSITKTRVEPDGRTITTTYRVSTTPTLTFEEPPRADNVPPYKPFRSWYDQPNTPEYPRHPRPVFPQTYGLGGNPFAYPAPRITIASCLYGLGLTIPELEAQRGEYVKTIVDEDGRTLVVKLSLSSPLGR